MLNNPLSPINPYHPDGNNYCFEGQMQVPHGNMLDASNLSASENRPIYTEVSLKFSNRLGNSGMDS